MRSRITVMALLGVIAFVCAAPQAYATIELKLTNGASTVDILDGGAGDACPAADCVTFVGSVGNYNINVSTGLANNGVNPFLDLNSVNQTQVPNAGLLTIQTSQDGYTVSTPQFEFQVGGTDGTGGNVSFAAYGGNSNTKFDTSNQIGSTLTFNPGAFSGTTSGSGNTVNPYSLTLVAQINGVTAGTTSFDAAINAVPEPSAVALFGTMLLCTAGAIRRKIRRS